MTHRRWVGSLAAFGGRNWKGQCRQPSSPLPRGAVDSHQGRSACHEEPWHHAGMWLTEQQDALQRVRQVHSEEER